MKLNTWLTVVGVMCLAGAAIYLLLFTSLPVKVEGPAVLVESRGSIEAVMFVNARVAQRVRAGMAAQIVPETVQRDPSGSIRGAVMTVGERPGADGKIEVRIALHGAPSGVAAGTRGTGTVVVDRRPIVFLIPQLWRGSGSF